MPIHRGKDVSEGTFAIREDLATLLACHNLLKAQSIALSSTLPDIPGTPGSAGMYNSRYRYGYT
jgi:hypothetical protein